jgi:hypothetical protein
VGMQTTSYLYITSTHVPTEMFYVWDFPTSITLQHPSCTGTQRLFTHPVHQTYFCV